MKKIKKTMPKTRYSGAIVSDTVKSYTEDPFFVKKTAEAGEEISKIEKGYEEFKIGALLQQARLKKGLTQEELAEKCGTNKGGTVDKISLIT